MGTSIQAIKSYLFRDFLDWDSVERRKIRQNLERFILFVVLIYIPLWNDSGCLFDISINNIQFFRNLEKFAQFDVEVANIAKYALCRHLNYMSEELSVLSIFSEKLSMNEKNQVARKLLQHDIVNMPARRIGRNQISNHIQYSEPIEFGKLDNLDIPALIGERSFYLFHVHRISTNFLNLDAELWSSNREYLYAKNIISKTLICVNDNYERVFAASKFKYARQRCRNNDSYRRAMLATSYKN